jgi:hypothetical protein
MEAARTSETAVYLNETIWRHIPECSNVHVILNISSKRRNFTVEPVVCKHPVGCAAEV